MLYLICKPMLTTKMIYLGNTETYLAVKHYLICINIFLYKRISIIFPMFGIMNLCFFYILIHPYVNHRLYQEEITGQRYPLPSSCQLKHLPDKAEVFTESISSGLI